MILQYDNMALVIIGFHHPEAYIKPFILTALVDIRIPETSIPKGGNHVF